MDIANVIAAVQSNRVRVTDHADEDADADKLKLDEIYFSVLHGEVIEDYPTTAALKVRAEVCLHCGERLYKAQAVRRFEEVRAKLERQETADFQPLGLSFQVA